MTHSRQTQDSRAVGILDTAIAQLDSALPFDVGGDDNLRDNHGDGLDMAMAYAQVAQAIAATRQADALERLAANVGSAVSTINAAEDMYEVIAEIAKIVGVKESTPNLCLETIVSVRAMKEKAEGQEIAEDAEGDWGDWQFANQ